MFQPGLHPDHSLPGSNTHASEPAFPPLSPAPPLKCDGITLSPSLKQAETDIMLIIFSKCSLGTAGGDGGIEVRTQVNLPVAPLLSFRGHQRSEAEGGPQGRVNCLLLRVLASAHLGRCHAHLDRCSQEPWKADEAPPSSASHSFPRVGCRGGTPKGSRGGAWRARRLPATLPSEEPR